jgi:hypothetical protein
MKTEDKDYLMDSFAKRAKEHPEYDDYYISLTDLEIIVEDFISNRLGKPVAPKITTETFEIKTEASDDLHKQKRFRVSFIEATKSW